jgi:hypothetical protein
MIFDAKTFAPLTAAIVKEAPAAEWWDVKMFHTAKSRVCYEF